MSSASGTQVALAAGVTYPHGGGRDASGTLTFLPHVGNISRNVIVRSQNPNGTRGHVLLTNRAEVDIRYTAFKDLGRTTIAPLDSTVMSSGQATHIGSNQVGRYSLHLHHLFGPASPAPNSYQYVLIGNAIDGGTRWGITIHNSHYGLVQDNVIYNAAGAGIMTEDGSETANVIQNNFIVRAWGTGHDRADGRQAGNDWGWEGSGIWLRGPDNYVRNNVIANVNSFAVTLMMLGVSSVRVPSAPGADPSVSGQTVNMMAVPLREFSSNEFYGSHRGIAVWNLGANCCTNVYDVPVSTFHNTRMWNVGVLGFYGYGENRVTFEGWVHYNDPSTLSNPQELNTSFYFGDYIARNIVIRHADIQGLRIGVTAPIKAGDTRDIYGGTPGTLVIENSTLKNYWNIYTNTPYGVTGGGSMIPPRVLIARNVQFSNVAGTSTTRPQAHVFRHFTPTQGTNANVTVQDRVVVESFNGNPNDNFEVFSPEQAPTFVIPSSPLTSHVAGLTNAQAWAASRVAISGAVAPCATTRAGIVGFICPAGPLPALSAAPPSPTPAATPTASTSPAPGPAPAPHTCAIPDPFVSLGGGTCVNGNWLPQALAPAPAAALSVRPARGAGTTMPVSPSMGSPAPAPRPISPATSGSRACSSSDPFVSMGGGTCSNGNWYPPSAPPPPPPPPPMTGGCATPDPFVSLGGGTCSNGNWNAPGVSSATSAPAPGGAPAPIPAKAGCTGTDPYARLPNVIGSCVSGSWIPVPREAGVASASASIPPPLPPPPVAITLNPAVKFQTINGWEASLPSSLTSASAMTEAQWSSLLDLAVNEMGVNRMRLDVAAGTEGPNGTGYAIVNDNADPNVIDPAGFNWTTLDQRIDRVILPWRQRVLARQETPYINLQYVDKADSSFEHYANPQEYAEFMVAVFQHLRTKYGFVPDAIEVIHQPNEVNGWRTAANIANVILATADTPPGGGLRRPGLHRAVDIDGSLGVDLHRSDQRGAGGDGAREGDRLPPIGRHHGVAKRYFQYRLAGNATGQADRDARVPCRSGRADLRSELRHAARRPVGWPQLRVAAGCPRGQEQLRRPVDPAQQRRCRAVPDVQADAAVHEIRAAGRVTRASHRQHDVRTPRVRQCRRPARRRRQGRHRRSHLHQRAPRRRLRRLLDGKRRRQCDHELVERHGRARAAAFGAHSVGRRHHGLPEVRRRRGTRLRGAPRSAGHRARRPTSPTRYTFATRTPYKAELHRFAGRRRAGEAAERNAN